MPEKKPLEKQAGHSLIVIRLIAVFKFLKAASLLIVGVIILRMIRSNHSMHETLLNFVNDLRLDENNHFIHGLLEKTLGIGIKTLRLLSTGTLIYSILFFTEGVGLWFDQGWAEVMTVITTAGFIPLEIWEIHRDPTAVRIIIFTINIALLVYILLRLRWRHHAKKEGVNLKENPVGVGH
ncbi:MAG TPA: DUF2127 domain-containing protein [Phycisphaerae bacterium]|nr:DUF2127 domain-containing protein [Phycisphaerae bacterium]